MESDRTDGRADAFRLSVCVQASADAACATKKEMKRRNRSGGGLFVGDNLQLNLKSASTFKKYLNLRSVSYFHSRLRLG